MSHKKISGYIIHLKESVGKGSYGEVFKGEHEQTKSPCAIKIINKKTSTRSFIKSTPTSTSRPPSYKKSKSYNKSNLKTLCLSSK